MPGLKFKQPLIGSAKEPISSTELLDRLSKLHEELATVDADHFKLSSLDAYKDDLVNKKLIKHKDIGVQAYVACCLSDILRIYAPDAPYTASQLSQVFKLFINQFKNMDSPYVLQNVYLITKLAEARSIILVTDLPDAEELIETIFETFYHTDYDAKIVPIISDLLSEIVSEWDSISSTVMKLMLNKFITQKSLPGLKVNDPGFNFTLAICTNNVDRLSRQYTKFFSEYLYELTTEHLDSIDDEGYKTLSKLHNMTVQIWKHVPELLSSVMGLIEEELSADNELFRVLATKTVGEMLNVAFLSSHKETFNTWMSKIFDISYKVRMQWVQCIPRLLNENAIPELYKGLTKTLIDSDERVRLASVVSIGQVNNIDVSILPGLIQLTREKHKEVRDMAITVLAGIYTYQKDISIPNALLNLFYINDPSINFLVDILLVEKIFTLESDSALRSKNMVHIVQNVGSKAQASFYAYNKRQVQLSSVMLKFIDFIDGYEGQPDIKAKLEKTINWLSVSLPVNLGGPTLWKFVDSKPKRALQLMKKAMTVTSDFKTVTSSIKEVLGKLTGDVALALKVLMYRASVIFYNKSNVPYLMDSVLVEEISQVLPAVFDVDMLLSQDNNSHTLKAVYKILKHKSAEVPLQLLKDAIIDGTPTQARYAIKIMAKLYKSSLDEMIIPCFPLDCTSTTFATQLSTIAELFLVAPDLLEDRSTDLTNYLIKHVLLSNDSIVDPGCEWIDDIDSEPQLANKIYALKVFTNRLRASESTTIAESVLKLLFSLINGGGEIVENTPVAYQSRLRLYAGLQVLKLSKNPTYNRLITPTYMSSLVYLLEDQVKVVRSLFVEKLKAYLSQDLISTKFVVLIFFMAFEPDKTLKSDIKTWLQFNKNKNKYVFEKTLSRLIYLLAYQDEEESDYMKKMTTSLEYMTFYFENVANEENINLLYYLANRVKQYEDLQGGDQIYAMADLCLLALNELKESKNWTLSQFPGKMNLPGDFYRPFADPERAKQVVTTVHLKKEFMSQIQAAVKSKVTKKKMAVVRPIINRDSKPVKDSKPIKGSKTARETNPKRKIQQISDSESDEEVVYKVATQPTRKSSRQRIRVDYADDSDEDLAA